MSKRLGGIKRLFNVSDSRDLGNIRNIYGIFSEIFGGLLFSEIFSRWKYPYIVLRKNKTKMNALIRPYKRINYGYVY